MNIVLIGYRGTGKSAVGTILAVRLKRKLVSTDDAIEHREACSITDIVRAGGWDYFREVESAVIAELACRDCLILDTGGGAVLRKENRDILKKNGVVFWLTASPATIIRRIRDDTRRPSLTPGKTFLEEVADVLAQRQPVYAEAADFIINTEGKTPEAVADEITALFCKREHCSEE